MNDQGEFNSHRTLLINFGNRIKHLREQKGWSQETLAQESGLHRTYIGGIERGERNVSLINIKRLAEALQTEMSELFKF